MFALLTFSALILAGERVACSINATRTQTIHSIVNDRVNKYVGLME
jgi:hypothetical protein